MNIDEIKNMANLTIDQMVNGILQHKPADKQYLNAQDIDYLGHQIEGFCVCNYGTVPRQVQSAILMGKAVIANDFGTKVSLAKQVIGIEIVPPAIEDAKENARVNGIENAQFHAAAAEDLLPKLVQQGLKPDVIMLDPPRKGCEEAVLEAICTCSPEKVVYISCDVATQARDAKYLTAHGYEAVKCQSVDMFCFTGHIENVLLFTQKTEAS